MVEMCGSSTYVYRYAEALRDEVNIVFLHTRPEGGTYTHLPINVITLHTCHIL